MTYSNKASNKIAFAIIATLATIPLATSVVGGVKGGNATYDKYGFYLAYRGAETGQDLAVRQV